VGKSAVGLWVVGMEVNGEEVREETLPGAARSFLMVGHDGQQGCICYILLLDIRIVDKV
jgi:hypothetical protein